MEKSVFHQRITQALLFISTFMTPAVFRSREFGSNSVDFQIFLKMGVASVALAYVLYMYRSWIYRLWKVDGVFYIPMILWFFFSCIYAPNFLYSLAAMLTFISLTSLLYLCSEVLEDKVTLRTVIYGCTLVTFVSLVVFYVAPDFGRGKEWINGQKMPGSRITGITGAPNAIGYISAFACLAIICYRLYLVPHLPKIFYVLFALNLIVQIMSNSRSSLLALIAAVGIGFLFKLTSARLAIVFSGICFVMAFLALVDINAFFAFISRSGDASEITTGTGRIFIWQQAIRMIAEQPFLGWGYASAGYLMPSFEHSSPHAHNMVLQILFMTGIIGLLSAGGLILIKIYYSVHFRDQFKITLLFFLLIQGLTEPSAFQGIANIPLLVLSIILALHYRNTIEAWPGEGRLHE